MTHNALVVGATRGLGAELAKKYAANGSHAFATGRSDKDPGLGKGVTFVPGIDVAKEDAGSHLAKAIGGTKLDTVIITAGYFVKESFDEPKFDEQIKMYTIGAIGPVFIVQSLVKAGLLDEGSKIILVSSEAGSITLRTESEGGGMYGHHASKTALNMVGKLLAFDLKSKGIAVGMVHPGFMRTELTKSNGLDKFYDQGGAVTPDIAAEKLIDFVNKFDIKSTGEFWAPRGAGDIGTVEEAIGPKDKLPTPFQIPW